MSSNAVMPPAVEISQLRHRYGEHLALDGINLTVSQGEMFGLLGPNGSGKSTLFRLLSTLIAPQDGAITIFGLPLETARLIDVRKRIGVVFQAPALDRMLTGYENLRHQAHLYGLRGAAMRQRIESCLASVDMADLANRRVDQMSGGQRRRVELAKALLHQPALLILDEPCTGLDPSARLSFLEVLRGQCTAGVTVLLTTHLMDEAEACNRLAILDKGKTVALGTPPELRNAVGGSIIILSTNDPDAVFKRLAAEADWTPVRVDDELRIESALAEDALPRIIALAGGDLTSVSLSRPTLQDAFLHFTGRRFGDAEQSISHPDRA